MQQLSKEYLATIDGVAIFPVVSLLIFSGFFVVLLWWTFRLKKTKIQQLKNIPLDD